MRASSLKNNYFNWVFLSNIVLPYYAGAEDMKNKLVKLIESSFPCVNLRLMFKSHSTIQNFFTYKDKIDQDLKSKIIYSVECLNCEKT